MSSPQNLILTKVMIRMIRVIVNHKTATLNMYSGEKAKGNIQRISSFF